MAFSSPYFGETTALRVSVRDVDGAAFTMTSATVTIKTAAGVATRSAVAATVDNTNDRVYYIETFSAANGYTENGSYVATFKVTMSDGYVEKFEDRFTVKAANDE